MRQASTRSTRCSSLASAPTGTTPRARSAGNNTAFVFEMDGLHAIHLGDVGHVLTEQMLGEIGNRSRSPASRSAEPSPAARAAELVAGLDANLVIPMPVGDEDQRAAALERFLKEMSVTDPQPVARLNVTISTVPAGDDRGRPGAARP